jgi:hypothetical protein
MDIKWLAEEVAKGRTDASIAAEAGVPVHQVGYYRRTALNTVRQPGNRRKWDIDRDWLVAQVAAGRSDVEIAAEKGMTLSAVRQYRQRMKVPPRPREERARAALLARYPEGRRGADAGNWRGGRSLGSSGYVRLYMPDHPAANRNGQVYEHRYVMEQKIGRLLAPGEVVDHIDRNRSNNAPENLRLHASRSEHVKEHFSARDHLAAAHAEIARLKALVGEA